MILSPANLFEAHITAKVKDAAKAKALRANKEAYRAMYDKYTEAFKGKIMEETARRAEAKIESADIESDIFAELESDPLLAICLIWFTLANLF